MDHIETRFTEWADKEFGPSPDPANFPQTARFASYWKCWKDSYCVWNFMSTSETANILTANRHIVDINKQLMQTIEKTSEFINEVAKQKPEKPDYWSSCGQCATNISKAEDIKDMYL